MVAIYVQRTWLKTISDVANLLLVVEDEGEYVSFLAGKVEVNFPFVEAKVARKEVDETHDVLYFKLCGVLLTTLRYFCPLSCTFANNRIL